jgi:hypothetical protein
MCFCLLTPFLLQIPVRLTSITSPSCKKIKILPWRFENFHPCERSFWNW